MIKNIIILVVIALLVLTVSNLSPINAQNKDKVDAFQSESDDYHRSVNERLVLNALSDLYIAQTKFGIFYGGGDFGTFNNLRNVGLIDDVLATGNKYGYAFSMRLGRTHGGSQSPFFEIMAKPNHYGRTGKKSFYMNTQCYIHGSDKNGLDADYDDPILEECSAYMGYQFEYDISYSIRQLMFAQQIYFEGAGNGEYGTIQDLVNAGLINQWLSIPWFMWIDMEIIPPTKQTAAGFKIWGTPPIYRFSGIRSYYVDETYILRAADLQGYSADENTPPLIFENEELIKYAMRSLWVAQRRFTCGFGMGCRGYATEFWQLSEVRLIDFEIFNGEFGGYQFEMNVVHSDKKPIFNDFEIKATPINYGKGSMRSFYIANHHLLSGADKGGQPADENDPFVEF